jgi:hypothetical protein
MDLLKSYLPAPVVDIFLSVFIVVVIVALVYPRLVAKIKATGVWDRVDDGWGALERTKILDVVETFTPR